MSARRTVKSVKLACLPSATVALFYQPISSLLGGRAITRAIRDGCAKFPQFLYSLARAERADPFPTPIYHPKSRLLTCRYLFLALCRAQIILEHFWRPRQAHAAQEEWAKRDTQLVSAPCLERDEMPPRALQQPPASGLLTSFSSVCLPISLFTALAILPCCYRSAPSRRRASSQRAAGPSNAAATDEGRGAAERRRHGVVGRPRECRVAVWKPRHR